MGHFLDASQGEAFEAPVVLDIAEDGFHIGRPSSSENNPLVACKPSLSPASIACEGGVYIDSAISRLVFAFGALCLMRTPRAITAMVEPCGGDEAQIAFRRLFFEEGKSAALRARPGIALLVEGPVLRLGGISFEGALLLFVEQVVLHECPHVVFFEIGVVLFASISCVCNHDARENSVCMAEVL